MTCRVENGQKYNQVYNAENRLATVQLLEQGDCPQANTLATANIKASWNFIYDGDGNHWDAVANFDLGRNYFGMAMETLVTHELGHIFTLLHGGGLNIIAGEYVDNWNKILEGEEAPITYRHASASSGSEMFADMFSAWVFGVWNDDYGNVSQVLIAKTAMNVDMAGAAATFKTHREDFL
jgi:hypothetical protein